MINATFLYEVMYVVQYLHGHFREQDAIIAKLSRLSVKNGKTKWTAKLKGTEMNNDCHNGARVSLVDLVIIVND